MKSYHWFSRPENRLRDFWQFQILALTLPVLWPWVNQLLRRTLSSESTEKKEVCLAALLFSFEWHMESPAPASAIVLVLGRHRDHCSLQGRDMCLVLGLPSSLQALTKIVQWLLTAAFVAVELLAQSRLTLRNPMDCSPPGSSVHWISQARILEWVVTSSSRGSSWPRDWTRVFCIAGGFFITWATREAQLYLISQINHLYSNPGL